MKKDQVRIGNLYSAKVSGGVVPVRITEEVWNGDKHGGWKGVNTETNRAVRIKSAQRLRAQVAPSTPMAVGTRAATKLAAAPVAPDAADVGPGAAGAGDGVATRKAASPRPPKAASAPKAKGGKRSQVRPTKGTKPAPRKKDPSRPMSGLDAAAKVLADKGEPMKVADIVEAAAKKGYWKSKAGKTPEATVYAAIIREIRDKGVESRFVKKDRGVFAASGKGG